MKYKLPLIILLILGLSLQAQQSPNEIAKTWLKDNLSTLKVNSIDEFNLRSTRKGLSGQTLRYQQTINGVPVFDSEIAIHISNKNKVSYVANNHKHGVTTINTTPNLSKTSVLNQAKQYMNLKGELTQSDSQLYVYLKDGNSRLAHVVHMDAKQSTGYWRVIIDAHSGEIIESKDVSIRRNINSKISHAVPTVGFKDQETARIVENIAVAPVDGTGMVFDPDPLSVNGVTYGGNYSDNNDATNASLDASRSSVTLRGIDLTGGTYKLEGQYLEIQDVEAPFKGLFTQNSPDFNFNRSNDAFEAVNCYYHLDKNMRYINETLGITLVSRFNSGVIIYDPSAWDGGDNSSYGGGVLKFGEGGVDDAEDTDVIIHELGHGIHDWITNGSLSQVDGLSEGCGDYWAQSYSRSLNQWDSSAPSYHHMFHWDGHNEFWGGRTTNYSATYPGGLTSSIHQNGQIWATVLMRIFDIIGREKTDKAFLEGLSMTSSSTNQEQAAIAVRQAAIDMNYSCADINVMTTQFTNTGYTMPSIPLQINCPGDLAVASDPTTTNFTIPDYTSMANAINDDCNATVTQSPAVGTVVSDGSHQITITASSGGASVNCTFELTVDSTLSVDEFDVENQISIYPNPANDIITIDRKVNTLEKIEVYNILGARVHTQTLDKLSNTINVANLSSGVYFISFENRSNSKSYKFIKN